MDNQINEWQRTKTTRRYIHPPKAERLITLWAEGKVMLGEVIIHGCHHDFEHEKLISHGIWFVYGDGRSADFKTPENFITDDGVPVHALENDFGNIRANIEAVSDIDRKPTGYIKVVLKNDKDSIAEEKFGFMLRTSFEKKLIFGSPDVYYPYNPDISSWKNEESTWEKVSDSVFADGDRFVCVNGATFDWDKEKGIASLSVALMPGEEKVFYLSIGKGTPKEFDYEKEKERATLWWRGELAKITKLPGRLSEDQERLKQIRHLTAQILQCFCYHVGKDFLLSRQGGLQRLVWPFEAMFAMDALDRIGDFAEYTEAAIDTYFNEMQTTEGEVVPMGIRWAVVTGNVLHSFAVHALNQKDDTFYIKYRDKALKAFEWIRATRALSAGIEGCFPGLFPPLASSDCQYVFQSFLMTDFHIVYDLGLLVKALEKYNDGCTDEVRAEYESYKGVLKQHIDYLIKEAQGKDEIRHTVFVPEFRGDEDAYSFQPSVQLIPWVLDIEPDDIERIINFGKKRGFMDEEKGLYQKMKDGRPKTEYNLVDDDGETRVWYVTFAEYGWFNVFRKTGDKKRMEKIIEGAEKYAMTDDIYMIERYHPRDPYFAPWSPNASANGRFIQMLLDFE